MDSTPQYGQWLNILKWSLGQSAGTSNTSSNNITEEDKAWLKTAMKELVKDEGSRLLDITKELISLADDTTMSNNDDEHTESILEELRDIVEQIDLAQTFVKYGGTKCLIHILKRNTWNNQCRALAASIIGTVSQNNIIVQDELFKKGDIEELYTAFVDIEDPIIRNKVLFAISCVIRNHAVSEEIFITSHVNQIIPLALCSDFLPLRRRALFLSSALLHSDTLSDTARHSLINILIPSYINLLSSDDMETREFMLNVVHCTVRYKSSFLNTVSGEQGTYLDILRTELEHILSNKQSLQSASDAEINSSRPIISNESSIDHDEESRILNVLSLLNNYNSPTVSPDSLPPPPVMMNGAAPSPTINAPDAAPLLNEREEATEILMIAPPPLNAASAAP
mmetsp:Transcript_37387/g.38070  ORF Transcript_37387/g.38070 Transcript_37387/m.38070 type:complete len:396 (-) Transcript_37387:123-1310(-)|eukprot:CAMPEP_0182429784 /NCGR_PEP_ID=MMETSP1167-20130531/33797_1 /TAXON_ID=2988 /ORGANISM="Mallomonas Sp, Strain CCMP3275" /LENGTH=395 /DNA_ID=CAMNT_0024614029 /DNA_START=81 /DNA_END=1268 /DNA_ORIENTATION=-